MSYQGWSNYATWHAMALMRNNSQHLNEFMHTIPSWDIPSYQKENRLRHEAKPVLFNAFSPGEEMQINWREIVEWIEEQHTQGMDW